MSRPYAVCKVALSPLRKEMSDASEMISQVVFGEILEVLATNNQWIKVRAMYDGYEGYLDEKLIFFLREKEMRQWMDQIEIQKERFVHLEGPEGSLFTHSGSFLPSNGSGNFQIGALHFSQLSSREENYKNILDFSLSFLNTPYLWGGKTSVGTDCSGLIQTVFRAFGHNLPRDAFEQAERGEEVDFEDRQEADLAFFINETGKIHHVGLLLNKSELIHAHGYVRIDDLNENGITRKLDGVMSHKLAFLKRVF